MKRKLRKLIIGQKGVGLMEAVVSVGIMGVVMAGFAQFMVYSVRSQKRLDVKNELFLLKSGLQASLISRNSCTQVIGTSQTLGTGTPAIRLSYAGSTLQGEGGGDSQSANPMLAAADLKAEQLFLDEIQNVGPSETAGYTRYRARVRGQFRTTAKIPGATSFAPVNFGTVVLAVRNSDNRINGCEKGVDGPGLAGACAKVGGVYNPATGDCSMDALLNSFMAEGCQNAGGTFNPGSGTCTTPSPLADLCAAVGGSYSGGACRPPAISGPSASNFLGANCNDLFIGYSGNGSARCASYGFSGGGDH